MILNWQNHLHPFKILNWKSITREQLIILTDFTASLHSTKIVLEFHLFLITLKKKQLHNLLKIEFNPYHYIYDMECV